MVTLQGNLESQHFADDSAATYTKDTTPTALSLHRTPSMCSEDWNRMSKMPPPASKMQPSTPGGHTGGASSLLPNPKPSYTVGTAASSVPGVSYVSYDGSNTGSMYPLPPVFGCAACSLLALCIGVVGWVGFSEVFHTGVSAKHFSTGYFAYMCRIRIHNVPEGTQYVHEPKVGGACSAPHVPRNLVYWNTGTC